VRERVFALTNPERWRTFPLPRPARTRWDAMQRSDANSIYNDFVRSVASSRRAWCLTCAGDVCAVHGASGRFMLPLWPDEASARYFVSLHWPDLRAHQLALHELLWRCLIAADLSDIPAGVGVAPDPEAVVVPARRLRLDLIRERLDLT